MIDDILQLLIKAIIDGDILTVQHMVDCYPQALLLTDDNGWSVLHYVASKGDVNIANIIIAKVIHLDIRDKSGATPLHYAASEQNGAVTLLLEAGADVNVRDDHGETPLHWIAAEGDGEDTVRLLLKYGADTEIRNRMDNTARDIALHNDNAATAFFWDHLTDEQ